MAIIAFMAWQTGLKGIILNYVTCQMLRLADRCKRQVNRLCKSSDLVFYGTLLLTHYVRVLTITTCFARNKPYKAFNRRTTNFTYDIK